MCCRSYLGMRVHRIDQDTLKREKRVLACQRSMGRHTYDNVAKSILDVHMAFNITSNAVGATTDNGSNFVKAFT